jgi:hypothetical protein
MRHTRHLPLLSFLLFLFITLGLMTGCSGQSELPPLELSDTRPSLLLFYTDD